MAFEAITTQEQLDAIIKGRLEREQSSAAKKYEGYTSPADLQTIKDQYEEKIKTLNNNIQSVNAEKDKLTQSITEKDAKIKGYETASVKTRIAHECGLSYDAINFLQGDDEKSIKASAEALSRIVGNGGGNAPRFQSEPGDGSDGSAAVRGALKGALSSLRGE